MSLQNGMYAAIHCLQTEYETQAATAGADEKIKSILDGLKETHDIKAKELQETEVGTNKRAIYIYTATHAQRGVEKQY